MKEPQHIIAELQAEIERLQKQLNGYQQLQHHYEAALNELRTKDEFNYALFKFSPITMVVVNREGRIVRSNAAKLSSGDRIPEIGSVMYRDYANCHSIDMYAEMMNCIRNRISKTFPKMKYKDKYLSITIAPFPQGAIIASQDITEQVRAEHDRTQLIAELRKALSEIETLRGLLPICSACKKIRNDQGYWQTVEEYFSKHGNLDFSHTICPECFKKLYPEFWEKQQINQKRAK